MKATGGIEAMFKNFSMASFKDLGSAIQGWVISVAVLIGGCWTLYTFVATDSVGRARREAFQQALVAIKVEARPSTLEKHTRSIVARVSITNTGTRNVSLDYAGTPFTIARVRFDDDGHCALEPELGQGNLFSSSRVFRAGETVEYPFYVEVKEAGLYVAQFRVPIPPPELPHHLAAGGPEGKIYWVGTCSLEVP